MNYTLQFQIKIRFYESILLYLGSYIKKYMASNKLDGYYLKSIGTCNT